MTDDPWKDYPPPGVPIFITPEGGSKPTYETIRSYDGTIEIVMPTPEKVIQSIEAAREYRGSMPAFDDKTCSQKIGEHICNKPKSECGPDDPHTVHHCFYGDCDWKSMEYVMVKRGQLSVADAVLAGHARNRLGERAHNKTTEELVAWMEESGPSTCQTVRENMRRLEAGP